MTSYILLQDLHFHAHIGVGEQERVVGSEYVLDPRLGYPFAKAMKSDDVADTLNYTEIFNVIREVMKQPAHLLESAAGSIVEALCAVFPMLSSIDLKFVKLNPLIGADSDGVGTELHLIDNKTEDQSLDFPAKSRIFAF